MRQGLVVPVVAIGAWLTSCNASPQAVGAARSRHETTMADWTEGAQNLQQQHADMSARLEIVKPAVAQAEPTRDGPRFGLKTEDTRFVEGKLTELKGTLDRLAQLRAEHEAALQALSVPKVKSSRLDDIEKKFASRGKEFADLNTAGIAAAGQADERLKAIEVALFNLRKKMEERALATDDDGG